MQLFLAVIFITIYCFANNILVYGQQDGPAPPRLNIPGAFPISGPVRPQFRSNERLNNPGPVIRIRKPNSRPNISLPQQQDAKPVTEEPEDIPNTFIPQIVQQQQQQPQQDQRQNLFQSEQNSILIDEPAVEEKPLPRFQERPAPQQQNRFPPELQGFGPQQNTGGTQRFALNTERPPKPTTLRARTIFREQPKQHHQQQYDSEPIQNIRPQARYNIQPRPQQYNPVSNEERQKKPVAQILRKYREENEDGSITWGFENDDGSFKEETIGIDCVTRGRYGYIDPDGLKREYNYETGNLCDPNKRNQHHDDDDNNQQQQQQTGGYVNYENNKAILPNGVEIDLASMGKKKSKRPGAILTNPQQFYSRN